MTELADAGSVAGARTAGADRIFNTKQQAVQINRDDLRGVDGREAAAIGKPAGAEVPAAFGCCTYVAIQLRRVSPAAACEICVFTIGLIARRVGIIPIAIQNRAVRHGHDAAMRRGAL
jgi:hypothetical protein